jgi:hypothetical protein
MGVFSFHGYRCKESKPCGFVSIAIPTLSIYYLAGLYPLPSLFSRFIDFFPPSLFVLLSITRWQGLKIWRVKKIRHGQIQFLYRILKNRPSPNPTNFNGFVNHVQWSPLICLGTSTIDEFVHLWQFTHSGLGRVTVVGRAIVYWLSLLEHL